MCRWRLCSIVPPHILRNIADRGDVYDRERARATLARSSELRAERQVVAEYAGEPALPPARKQRTIYDARGERELPGRLVRAEGDKPVRDKAANEAYDGSGKTYDYFRTVHGRNSIDDRGMRLESTVHYGVRFDNAQWDGARMICGDGDNKYFLRFTRAIDIIAHELTHGITQYTARLGFTRQSGALNEHFSDVFGSLVKQYAKRQKAEHADWLVGAGIFTTRVRGKAIRSLKAPGTAYDDRVLGADPQPRHMRDYVKTDADSGGVHINSGIPNHAFYLVATMLGGKSWDVAGRIWYDALTRKLHPRSRFQHCADATYESAGELFGLGAAPQEAVRIGWQKVGIEVSPKVLDGGPRLRVKKKPPRERYEAPAGAAEMPMDAALSGSEPAPQPLTPSR